MTVEQALRIRVAVRLWGLTETDVATAERKARRGWGRHDWDFVEVERLIGARCPLDVHDPGVLAAAAGYGWAYTAHRAHGAAS